MLLALIPRMLENNSKSARLVYLDKITLDLIILTFLSEMELKALIVHKMVSQFFLLVLEKSMRSSSKNMWEILGPPLLMEIVNKLVSSTSWSIYLESMSRRCRRTKGPIV